MGSLSKADLMVVVFISIPRVSECSHNNEEREWEGANRSVERRISSDSHQHSTCSVCMFSKVHYTSRNPYINSVLTQGRVLQTQARL